MLRGMGQLEGAVVRATDDDVGHVRDFYFNDEAWLIRYLVVETGNWRSRRRKLIAPVSIGHPGRTEKFVPVLLTQDQVRNCPGVDSAKALSRQFDAGLLGVQGRPGYGGGALWETGSYPNPVSMGHGVCGFSALFGGVSSVSGVPGVPGISGPAAPGAAASSQWLVPKAGAGGPQQRDPHLRSCNEIKNYQIQALDGEIGHVTGMLIDDETWAIRYMVVDAGSWWIGHPVLIAPRSIRRVNWFDHTVSVDLTRQAVKACPRYDPGTVEQGLKPRPGP